MINNYTTLILKISCAFIFSLLIGLDREEENKAAGLRTCVLLCVGMTFLMILNEYMIIYFGAKQGVLRLPAYCIMSIGFLGSGIIIYKKGQSIGITTACVLLHLVAIGMFCGIGKYFIAGTNALACYSILKLKHIEHYLLTKNKKGIKHG